MMAGVSPALATMALRRLERLGHVHREPSGQVRFLDLPELLKAWATWYASGPIISYRYSMESAETAVEMIARVSKNRAHLPGRWALTAMAGASLVVPSSAFNDVHVHLLHPDRLRNAWRRQLQLRSCSTGPFHILHSYYAEAGLFGSREIRKLPVVSDVQLYLECCRYPVRGREQAQRLLERIAKAGGVTACPQEEQFAAPELRRQKTAVSSASRFPNR